VRDFARLAFEHVGLNWENHVVVDPQFYRPADVHTLCGDSSKARTALRWQPEISFDQLISMMVDADLQRVQCERQERDDL
jgi:GDPmannose 4,6-dehydratase